MLEIQSDQQEPIYFQKFKLMTNSIVFEDGFFGLRAVVISKWQDYFLERILEKEVKEIELNIGKGWRGENVEFLRHIPDLNSIRIADYNLTSIEPVHYLHNLKSIDISTYCNTPIRFSEFPDLIDCSFEWRKKSDSIFECINLEKLAINNFDSKSAEKFESLQNLQELTLLNSKIENLHGIDSLSRLFKLRLGNLKSLSKIEGIKFLNNLKILDIGSCKKINSIVEVFNLLKLETLLLNDIGEIDSIDGIENLVKLKLFTFYESTNIIDGDLTQLKTLKNLTKLSFQNRRHYTHKREEFPQYY
jgi:hypothetical protein